MYSRFKDTPHMYVRTYDNYEDIIAFQVVLTNETDTSGFWSKWTRKICFQSVIYPSIK